MRIPAVILALAFALSACKREEVQGNLISDENYDTAGKGMSFNPEGQKILFQGTFESAVHATSGSVKIYENTDKKRTLVIENFKTDAGPDLRIYLAEDRSVTNFLQLTDKVQNGHISLDVPYSADLQKQNYVLIWCKKFSVLFGFANLKKQPN